MRSTRTKVTEEYSDTAKREVSVDVGALLRTINEICESEIHCSLDDLECINVDGRDYHIQHELADAFELDIHDFSMSEINRWLRVKKIPVLIGSGSGLLMQEALVNSLHQKI